MNLFKKTLVAAAVTAVSANAFAADTAFTAGTGDTFSVEGASIATEVRVKDVVVTIDPGSVAANSYSNANELSFTVAGSSFTFASSPTVAIVCKTAPAATMAATLATVSYTATAAADIAITSDSLVTVNLDSTAAVASGIVACLGNVDDEADDDLTTDAVTEVATITLSGATANTLALGLTDKTEDAETTLAFSVDSTSGLPGNVDKITAEAHLTGTDEFQLDLTKAAKDIDVGEDRMLFDHATANSDTIVLDLDTTTPATDAGAVTLTNVDYTITTDLSFLDADSDGNIDTNNSITVSAGGTINTDDLTAITVSETAATGAPLTVTITVDGVREIPVTSFSVAAATTFTVANAILPIGETEGADSETASGGSWALNGTSGNVSYMPYGDNISQIIYITNTSAVEGGVSYTARDEDGTKYSGTLPTVVKANGVTQIAGDLKADLAAQGFTSGKLNIDLTAEITSGTIYAAYNVGGTDRGFVSNK